MNTANSSLPRHSVYTHINLYSPARSIDHIFLLDTLKKQFKLPCRLTPSIDPKDEQQLALIDCGEVAATKLQAWFQRRALQGHHPKCVLINAEENSDHIKLMEWPQLVGIFYRTTHPDKFERGINNIVTGGLWFPRQICHDFLSRRRRAPTHNVIKPIAMGITPRERQMLDGIYSGLSNASIAKMMRLSEHTVKSHMYSVYKKIGVRSRLEASNWLHDNYSLLESETL